MRKEKEWTEREERGGMGEEKGERRVHLTLNSLGHLLPGPHQAIQYHIAVVHGMSVRLFCSEIPQLPTEQLLEDLKPLRVHRELSQLAHDLGEKSSLLVTVSSHRDLKEKRAKYYNHATSPTITTP